MTLSSPTNATVVIGTGTVTIGASGAAPVATPNISAPPDVIVGAADGYVDLPVTLSPPGTSSVTVNYSFGNQTAVEGTVCPDAYNGENGTLTFTPGQTVQVIRADILNCGTSSTLGLRSFRVNLTPNSGAGSIVRASTRVGIVGNGNPTATPGLSVRNAVVDNGAGFVQVPVLLGGPSGTAGTSLPVTVNYSTHDGTALAGSDYTATSGTLTFGLGQTAQNITVPIAGRSGAQPARTFTVTLSSPTNATVVIGTGTVTIGASGAAPVATPNISAPPDVIVGAADGYVDLPVTLSPPGTSSVTVNYSFANQTAVEGTVCPDAYNGENDSLTFTPGQTVQVIRADILNCGTSSTLGLRSFRVNLTPNSGAGSIVRASTRVGIVGNGNPTATPGLSVRNAVVDNGAGFVQVPVLLGGPSGTAGTSPVTVNYSTHDGTALAGSDYTATSGTLTFPPGETAQTITVPIAGRSGAQPARTFTVTLSSPTNATVVIGTGTVTIGASGAAPVATPNISAPPDVIVGAADGYVDLPVTLSPPGTSSVTVNYSFANQTAVEGTVCPDAYNGENDSLTFTPGQTVQVIRADILNCGTSSTLGLRSFRVNLTPNSGAGSIVRASTRVGIVGNGNPTATPGLSVRNAVVDNGAGFVQVPVLLGGPSGTAGTSPVTVNYSTHDGTALAGSDYTATSGTLTFPPGETAQTITVPIAGRSGAQPARTFTVTLSSPTNATVVIGTGTVTIGASGAAPVATPNISAPPDVIVGAADGYVDLPVTLSPPGTSSVTVNYSFGNQTAVEGTVCPDAYNGENDSLTFTPGQTVQVVRVDILNCGNVCPGMFTFNLSGPNGATIGPSSTTVSIGSCSTGPALAIAKAHTGAFVTGQTGTYTLTVTNTGGPTSGAVTVKDTLPTGETFSAGTGGGFACSAAAQAVTCTSTTSIVTGTPAVITLTVNVTAAAGTVLSNSATVSPNGSTSNTDQVTVTSTVSPPVLAIAKAHVGSFVTGKTGTYTLTVTNTGGPTSGAVTVKDTLPTGETFSAGTGGGFACSAAAQAVTCTSTTSIVTGTPAVITLTVNVTAAAGTVLSNSATVSPNGSTSNTDQVTVTSTVSPPVLAIAKAHTGAFVTGKTGTYTLTVTNTGGPTSGKVTVSDTVPAGETFASGTGGGFTCSAVAQVVTCTSTTSIVAGTPAVITLTVNVTAAAGTVLSNSATVSPNGGPSNTDQVTVQPVVVAPALAIAKIHTGAFVTGKTGTYTLTVTNTGGPTSGAVAVKDTLPTGETFASGSGGGFTCSAAAQAVTCTSTTSIVTGTPAVITLTVNITAAAGTVLSNSATVSPNGGSSAVDMVTVQPVVVAPALAIAKAHTGAFVTGQTGTYSLTVTNSGGATSGTVTVSDTLPTGETFSAGTGGGFTCSAAAQAVTCTSTTSIVTGIPAAITLTVNVTAAAGTVLSNSATVSPNGGPSNTDQVTVTSGVATTLTTSLSGGRECFLRWCWGHHRSVTATPGGAVSDSATLSGADVATATGTVTYSVYSDSACTVSAGSGGTVEVTAGTIPSSMPVSLSTPGTYYWQASYSGDATNAASTSSCGSEVETVSAPRPQPTQIQTMLGGASLRTGWWNEDILEVTAGTAVTDSATLTGANVSSAGGMVTYTVSSDTMCFWGWLGHHGHGGSSCAPQVLSTDMVTVTDGVVPNSSPVTLPAGVYLWQASYSGDATNQASTSPNGSETEIVVAPRPLPTQIQTTLGGGSLRTGWWNQDILTVTAGTAVTDSATLSGANVSSAGGTVTYTVSSDRMCFWGWFGHDGRGESSCAPQVVSTDMVTVTNGVVPNSSPVTLPAGIYSWQASYSGDATNQASTSPDGSETEIVSP